MKKPAPERLRAAMLDEMESGEILERALTYSREYAASVRNQRVFPGEAALEGLKAFDEALPGGAGDAL